MDKFKLLQEYETTMIKGNELSKEIIDNFTKIDISVKKANGENRHMFNVINDLKRIWDSI